MGVCCLAQTTPTALPTVTAPPPGAAPPTVAPAPDTSKGTEAKNALQQQLERRAGTVHKWSLQAKEEIALSFAIGLLGLLVGALQGSQWTWTKKITVASGLAISVMTLCTNTFFPADYRTLQICVSKANTILGQLEFALANFDPAQSSANLQAAESDFMDKCGKIDLIEQNMLGKGQSSDGTSKQPGTGMLFEPMLVYAQSTGAAPAWINGKASDGAFTYFVGKAEGTSLLQAKNDSFANAVDQAAHWLRGDQHAAQQQQQAVPEPTQQLLDLVKRSSDVADTWYSYENARRTYTYFTLLRITNALHSLDVKGLDPESELGSGIGPFRFGMSPQDVNAKLPHPFGSVASMPVAGEFKTAEVRYFWVPTAQFPPPNTHNSPFEALRAFQPCWGARSSYMTFLFARNELFRISTRFFWDCPERVAAASSFADAYSIPNIGGSGNPEFCRVLSQASVEVSISKDGTAVDVFRNGSPAPAFQILAGAQAQSQAPRGCGAS
jgi:hypothetical protein